LIVLLSLHCILLILCDVTINMYSGLMSLWPYQVWTTISLH